MISRFATHITVGDMYSQYLLILKISLSCYDFGSLIFIVSATSRHHVYRLGNNQRSAARRNAKYERIGHDVAFVRHEGAPVAKKQK